MKHIYVYYSILLIVLHCIYYYVGIDSTIRRDLLKNNPIKYTMYKHSLFILNLSLIFYLRYCIVEQFK